MAYRIQLNMKTQEFIAIDPKNAKHVGKGDTIEKALQQLKRWLITADFLMISGFSLSTFRG